MKHIYDVHNFYYINHIYIYIYTIYIYTNIISLSSYNEYKIELALDLLPTRLHTLVGEHHTGIAEVMGSNLVEASDFFLGFLFKLIHNWEDHFHF